MTDYSRTSCASQPENFTADIIPIGDHIARPDRAEMIASIQEFCMKRNFEDALSREEIARLGREDRLDAQRKSLLINTAQYYRANPKADVAVGVLNIITLLSDNDKGACTLSQTNIGLILGRSRTTISEAVTRLKASGLVRSENGKAQAFPTIPRVVTQHYNHVVWVMDALKTVPTCRLHGTGQHLSAPRDTHITPVPSRRQASLPTCPVVASEPVGSTGHNFNKLNSTKLHRAASVVAAGIATAIGVLPAAASLPAPPSISQPAEQISMRDLSDKLFEAAGNAMNRTVGTLEVMATPKNWLDNGCDLELDVLPVVRALAARRPPQSLKTWGYFTEAIADAKAKRIAPMPEGRAPRPKSQASNWHDEQEKALNFLFRK